MCLCEGVKGQSTDAVFISRLMKSLHPPWLRPWPGSNAIRLVPCGGRQAVIERLPAELANCRNAGGNTTLMVWADCDHDCASPDALRELFWQEASRRHITTEQFDSVVFALAKDRLENWIEFLAAGRTDECREGPRVKHTRQAADAARKLAEMCRGNVAASDMPPSLQWSCVNWRALVERMRSD